MTSERMQFRVIIENNDTKLRTVVIEPWAIEFKLKQQEEIELVGSASNGVPYFQLQEWNDTTVVYCENADQLRVFNGGNELVL